MPRQALYAIDANRNPVLGPIQLGLQKLRWRTPWTDSTRTISRAMGRSAKRAGAVATAASKALARGVVPPAPCLPSSMVADLNLNQSMRAWAQRHLNLNTEAQWQALLSFNPMRNLHDHSLGLFVSPEEQRVWQQFMTLAALPAGLEWLRTQGHTALPSDPHQLALLKLLGRACVSIQQDTGHMPSYFPSTLLFASAHSVAQQAAQGAVDLLRYKPTEHTAAMTALRNNLHTAKTDADRELIEARLRKLGVWMKRWEKPGFWTRLVPLIKKSPLRAALQGLQGADRGGDRTPDAPTLRGKHWLDRRDLIRRQFHHVVDHIQGASRMRWSQGGRIGLNTKGLTGTLTQLLTAMVVRLKLNLQILRARQAGLELAMPPYNLELLLYSSTGRSVQAGAGAAVGPKFGHTELTAGLDVQAIAHETMEHKGIALRLPRIRGQEESLRRNFKALLDDLLTWSQPGYQPRDGLLNSLLAKYPDLSVSVIDRYTDTNQAHSVSLEAGVGVGAGPLRLAASADTGATLTTRQSRQVQDTRGAITVDKRIIGKHLKLGSGARVDLRLPVTHNDVRFNALHGELFGVSVDWAVSGQQVRLETVRQDGLLHGMSFMEVEYLNHSEFEQAVLDHLGSWVHARAQAKKISPEKAHQQIMDFLDEVRAQRHTIRSYGARAELKAAVVNHVNQLATLQQALLLENSPQARSQAAEVTDFIRRVLEHPSSYEPTSFRIYERTEQQNRVGVRMGLHLDSHLSSEGVHAQARLM
ncbi:MAG: hypothetical protein ACK4FF_07740 [Limnobacter sp.]|uniref:hypothetical protein n=1 Tax=Limnobacter sp. TaxID=2003368 RepID=UPI00391C6ED8